ncbi:MULTISPECIES: folylpolyglutamate synthase/dihydrofolate synthase family protein [unclassified Streptococcus]|uniref:bifunctional folylpolyglutamate synthase/dihydrofolate synthase n=1 Tax=unclassified Streptococcus TaxID=2608887 RepID=UPI0010718C1C|nr:MULTISPECIES: folylpolyglutamate synthase/dihydrofolate synthase family protein [unclassified Streptococcus]MBF0787554.1 bifunctional folylpolyglutamate synthase/dihydrofolate synthase [Streptococcus sp. 19428wC2_LYSM12]MCQ9211420.1 bifunctional folylpolyglutamate synthase/dihydrofolate synthase [Streptococcus sp. B01]MCQ9214734.1 bifunctional folylpolyglutamate synthase/dihydrofolate synthase [Streptococcus sp. O1]TFV05504.1 bifunctional folylpolyglutamate synthase/dihydrofolate synthase [S
MTRLDRWLQMKQGQVYRYKIEKVQYSLDLLGHPEKALPVVHVAGTNGKGSTIAFLKNLLESQGFCVGAFVSPHMVTVHDRICVNGEPIPDAIFQELLEKIFVLEQEVERVYEPFRYFEVLTLVMLLYFKEQALDFALIEAGIGGLLDTTNIVEPMVTIITSIGLDHQDLLGSRIEEIAEQKAGIIKSGVPILVGPVDSVALEICRRKAALLQAPIYCEGVDFSLTDGLFTNKMSRLEGLRLGLAGQHQEENAALALQAFHLLMEERKLPIEQTFVRQSLEITTWAGRLEKVGQQGQIYLDGAHNLPAIERLVEFIQSLSEHRVTILFSALKRKDFREMLGYIQKRIPHAELILTSFAYDGSMEERDCLDELPYVADYVQFIQKWEMNAKADELLFITGSLYFISEVRKYIKIVNTL